MVCEFEAGKGLYLLFAQLLGLFCEILGLFGEEGEARKEGKGLLFIRIRVERSLLEENGEKVFLTIF